MTLSYRNTPPKLPKLALPQSSFLRDTHYRGDLEMISGVHSHFCWSQIVVPDDPISGIIPVMPKTQFRTRITKGADRQIMRGNDEPREQQGARSEPT
jgi:hypothetical protein